jgi:hypothetical protein
MTLLYNEPPVAVSPTLATALGLPAAAFLQQLHYWLEEKRANPAKYADSFANGHAWVYDSAEKWVAKMPYLGSVATFKRMLADLRKLGILVVERHNKKGFDKTSWYRIDKDQLDLIVRIKMSQPSDQNDTTVGSNRSDAAYQTDTTNTKDSPETTPETTSNTNTAPAARERETGQLPLGLEGVEPDPPPVPAEADPLPGEPKHDPIRWRQFWEQHPRKEAKPAAVRAWDALKPTEEVCNAILHDIARSKGTGGRWVGREKRHIPQPATYLNQHRWEDDWTPTKPGQPPPLPRHAHSASDRMQADLDALMNA